MSRYDIITIIGPTASGKTNFACGLANILDTEIISGDSRQVYTNMDIGTGKDLSDYIIEGKNIPYHLIDIKPAGYKYNIYEFQHDFHKVYNEIKERGKLPIFCGGSGLYIESVLRGYKLANAPENKSLREELKNHTLEELIEVLSTHKTLHNKTDIDTVQRAIRAIEIAMYQKEFDAKKSEFKPLKSLTVGIEINRDQRRDKISKRLLKRLEEGMIDEVKNLLNSGIAPEDLIYYGLEYKFVTMYLKGRISYDQMISQLEIAIFQFAKRQMTWFRGMERRGIDVLWLNSDLSFEEKAEQVMKLLR